MAKESKSVDRFSANPRLRLNSWRSGFVELMTHFQSFDRMSDELYEKSLKGLSEEPSTSYSSVTLEHA